MFGVDDMLIIMLVASIASAAMQAQASQSAANKASEQTRQALARQAEFQKQAESRAMEQVRNYNSEDREEKRQAIEEQLSDEYYQPVEAMQNFNALGATTQGNVSSDYLNAKANSDASQLRMAKELANLFGKQTSAGRLLQGEGIDLANTASDINRIGSFAKGTSTADQFAINSAAKPDAGLTFMGQVAGSVAQAAGSKAASMKGTAGTTGTGLTGGTTGTGLGFKLNGY